MSSTDRKINSFRGILFSSIQALITVILQMILTPIIIDYIGEDGLGTYSFILQIIAWCALTDLGFSVAINRYLAQAYRFHNINYEFNKILRIGRTFGIFTNLLCVLVVLIIAFNLSAILNSTSDSILHEAFLGLISYSFWLVARIWFYYFPESLIAAQRMDLHGKIMIGSILSKLILSYILIFFTNSLLGLILAYIFSEIILYLFCYFQSKKTLSFQKIGFGFDDKKLAKEMILFGLSYAIVALSSKISSNTDIIILGTFISTSVIAMFYTTTVPGNLVAQFAWKLTDNINSALNQIYSQEGKSKFEEFFNKILFYNLALSIILGFGIILFNEDLVKIWVGESLNLGIKFTLIFAIAVSATIISHYFSIIMVLLNHMRSMIYAALISSLLKLIILFTGIKYLGVYATVISSVTFELVQIIIYYRILTIHVKFNFQAFIIPLIKLIIILTISSLLIKRISSTNIYSEFIFQVVIFLAVCGSFYYKFILFEDDRKFIVTKLRGR